MLELYLWQESRICLRWVLTWLDVFDMCLCSSKRIHTLILYTVLFSLYAGITSIMSLKNLSICQFSNVKAIKDGDHLETWRNTYVIWRQVTSTLDYSDQLLNLMFVLRMPVSIRISQIVLKNYILREFVNQKHARVFKFLVWPLDALDSGKRTRTTFNFKFSRLFSKNRHHGKLHCTCIHHKS